MTETPKCPYCGAEMLDDSYTWICPKCRANSPVVIWDEELVKSMTEEELIAYAREAALHRAEPEMRPLTREEVEAHCADGIDAMPLWVEYKHVPDISRWMCVDAPEHFSTWETIKILIREHGKNYGETRRCWPRKPTPEQMTAAKWEE